MKDKRRKALDSDLGVKIRNFLNDALQDADMLPGKAVLAARVEEEFADVAGIDTGKLTETFVDFARRSQNKQARFDLRQTITEMTVNLVTKLDEADRLIDVEEEYVDVEGLLESTDRFSDVIGGDLARAEAKEQAEAAEIVRKSGLL